MGGCNCSSCGSLLHTGEAASPLQWRSLPGACATGPSVQICQAAIRRYLLSAPSLLYLAGCCAWCNYMWLCLWWLFQHGDQASHHTTEEHPLDWPEEAWTFFLMPIGKWIVDANSSSSFLEPMSCWQKEQHCNTLKLQMYFLEWLH